MKNLLKHTNCGLYCEAGDFYIDPWRSVDKAVITHAHSDHARGGSRSYLAAEESNELLKLRLGKDISLQTLPFNETVYLNGVKLSLHPAGHILGSAQVRIEYEGHVCVVSGDYKLEKDSTCTSFELVKCNTFITESTFGLPIYKWCSQNIIYDEINNWWRKNAANNITSVVYGYSLGKAQRILAGLDSSIGLVITHGAVENVNECYRQNNISLPETTYMGNVKEKSLFNKAIIVAPPAADSLNWIKKFSEVSTAFASGWMQIRGNRRRRNIDKGFILSDHADWDDLIDTIKGTGAESVCVTHGYSPVLVRYLNETGIKAGVLETMFGDMDEAEALA